MNRIFTLFAVLLACFLLSPVALAAPPDAGAAVEAKAEDDAKAEEAKEEAPEEATEAKAEEAKEETKADEAGSGGETEGAPPADDDVVAKAKEAWDAGKEGEYALMVAAIIMLLLGAARKVKLLNKVPTSALPWLSMVMGVLAAVAMELGTGGELTASRVLAGALAGMAASGAWGMLGKHLMKVSSASASS